MSTFTSFTFTFTNGVTDILTRKEARDVFDMLYDVDTRRIVAPDERARAIRRWHFANGTLCIRATQA